MTNFFVLASVGLVVMMVAATSSINCYQPEQERFFVSPVETLDEFENFQKNQPQQFLLRQRRQQPATDPGSGFLASLNNLAQQAQSVTQAQQLLQQAQSLFQPKQSNPFAPQSPAESVANSAVNAAQTTSQTAVSGASQAAQTAQTGVRSALSELTSGLQRIAQNNPNLLPEVKGLYQRVSSQLGGSSAPAQPGSPLSGKSSEQIQVAPANTPNELYDNLSKLAMPQQPPPAQQQSAGITNLLQTALQSAQG